MNWRWIRKSSWSTASFALALVATCAVVSMQGTPGSVSLISSVHHGPSISVLIDHHPRRGRSQRAVAAQAAAQVAAQSKKQATAKDSTLGGKLAKRATTSTTANTLIKGGKLAKRGTLSIAKDAIRGGKFGKRVSVLPPPMKPKKKQWTTAQKKVEAQVFAAMAAKHVKMEAAAKKSALSDYWKNIKLSLSSEKKRLGGFGASEALERANNEMYEDQSSHSSSKLRSRRKRMMQNKLSEMSQEKEMESEDAYKDVRSHQINYSACDSDCQAAKRITTGIGDNGGSSSNNNYFGSSYHDNFMSHSDAYSQSSSDSDDDFSAGR